MLLLKQTETQSNDVKTVYSIIEDEQRLTEYLIEHKLK